jgi:hypothetical protein
MIQPLRTVHRRAFVALAFVLAAVLVAGLEARRPPVPSRVEVLQLPSSAYLLRKSDTLWRKHSMQTAFYSDSTRIGDIQVALHPAQELNEPDLLLYWSSEEPTGDSVPATAQLLGAFVASKAFTLPLNIDRAGYLVLFSLPQQDLFDTAKVERLP